MPAVTPDQLAGARRYRTDAAVEVLALNYVPVYRIARGLCGSEKSAAAVLRFCMTRSMRVLRRWRAPEDPERWFYHHSVLASRRAGSPPADVRKDLLVESAGVQDPSFLAFVATLRNLPFQQREAFILHHGEKLNSRYLAVAMDCSTVAAETHLNSANIAMQALSGPNWEHLRDLFNRSYMNLTPPEQNLTPVVRRYVRRHIVPMRLFRLLRIVGVLVLIAALIYFIWHYQAQLKSLIP